jgi:hypothetical protein
VGFLPHNAPDSGLIPWNPRKMYPNARYSAGISFNY